MTRVSDKALAYLAQHGSMPASMIGAHLWPNRKTRGSAVQGGGDYAAQMLLGKLRAQNLVRTLNDEGSSRWALTGSGWHRVRQLEAK